LVIGSIDENLYGEESFSLSVVEDGSIDDAYLLGDNPLLVVSSLLFVPISLEYFPGDYNFLSNSLLLVLESNGGAYLYGETDFFSSNGLNSGSEVCLNGDFFSFSIEVYL
jgi:hypothetical protein